MIKYNFRCITLDMEVHYIVGEYTKFALQAEILHTFHSIHSTYCKNSNSTSYFGPPSGNMRVMQH